MKKLLTFLTLLTLFFTTAGAETSILSFTAECGGTGTADDGAVWTITSDAAESNYTADGIHYGTNSKSVKYLQLVTSDISGTVTNVKVMAKDAQGTGVITVTVGGTAFEFVPTTAHPSNTVTNSSGQTYEFTGSGSGEIVVKIERPNAQTKAIYCKSVTVQYTPGSTPAEKYSITVNQPAEGGQISADKEEATEGTTVNLTATPDTENHYVFGEWIVKDAANNDVTVTENHFTMPASAVTVTATFTALQQHSITVKDNTGTANPTTAYAGDEVTLTPALTDGQVVDWASTTISPTGLEINHTDYTFTMPDDDVEIKFAFKDDPTTNAFFYESFNDFNSTGGNSGGFATASNGEVSSSNDVSDNEGWDYTKAYPADKCLKFGGSKAKGEATTPTLTGLLAGENYTITFKAAPWSSESSTTMSLTSDGGEISGLSTDAMNTNTWNEFTCTFVPNGTSATLNFSASENRFFLDEVCIIAPSTTPQPATVDYYLVGNINGWNNENLTASSPYKFTKQNDGSYTLNVTLPDIVNDVVNENYTNNELVRFKIAKVENGGTPVWYGGSGNGDYGINRMWGNNTDITFGDGNNAFTVPDCYKAYFTLDVENMKFSVDKPMYLRESEDASEWTDTEMTANADGSWTITKNFAAPKKLFHFYNGWHEHRGSSETNDESYHIYNYETQERDLAQNGKNFYIRLDGNYTLSIDKDLTKLTIAAPKSRASIASSTGGSVSFNQSETQTSLNMYYNEDVYVYVTPSTDYELETLTYTEQGSSEAVTITATEGQYSFKMPAANVTVKATFNYTGTATQTTYKLVTSNDDIEAGFKYIIVNKQNSVALGLTQASNTGKDITINNDITVISSTSGVTEFVLCSAANGKYKFKNGNNYLENSSSTTVGQSSNEQYINWSVTVSNDGNATMINEGQGTIADEKERYLRYRSTSNDFRAYQASAAAGQSDVQLFKEVISGNTLAWLCQNGQNGNTYTIEEPLLGVYKSGNTIWFKDANGSAIDYQTPGAELVYWINDVSTKDFDQSNWIEVVFPSEANYDEIYVRNLTGTFTNANGNPKLTITTTDNIVESGTGAYTPNPYTPAHFGAVNGVNGGYFFSKPKAQEYAYFVKAQWNGSQMVMTSNTEYNSEGLTGSFSIMPVDGLDAEHHLNAFYQFHGIVRKGTVGSPRLQAHGDGIVVEAIDLDPDNVVTAISTVGVNSEVKSVKYVNVAGVVSDRPFQGVNIVVTEYTDGSRTTAKMVR